MGRLEDVYDVADIGTKFALEQEDEEAILIGDRDNPSLCMKRQTCVLTQQAQNGGEPRKEEAINIITWMQLIGSEPGVF